MFGVASGYMSLQATENVFKGGMWLLGCAFETSGLQYC